VVPHRVYKPSKTGTPNVVEAPKDLVGWFRRHPYLRTTEPKPATVVGIEGLRFDVAVAEVGPEGYRGYAGRDAWTPPRSLTGERCSNREGKGCA
jgi:hypothetical protein